MKIRLASGGSKFCFVAAFVLIITGAIVSDRLYQQRYGRWGLQSETCIVVSVTDCRSYSGDDCSIILFKYLLHFGSAVIDQDPTTMPVGRYMNCWHNDDFTMFFLDYPWTTGENVYVAVALCVMSFIFLLTGIILHLWKQTLITRSERLQPLEIFDPI